MQDNMRKHTFSAHKGSRYPGPGVNRLQDTGKVGITMIRGFESHRARYKGEDITNISVRYMASEQAPSLSSPGIGLATR